MGQDFEQRRWLDCICGTLTKRFFPTAAAFCSTRSSIYIHARFGVPQTRLSMCDVPYVRLTKRSRRMPPIKHWCNLNMIVAYFNVNFISIMFLWRNSSMRRSINLRKIVLRITFLVDIKSSCWQAIQRTNSCRNRGAASLCTMCWNFSMRRTRHRVYVVPWLWPLTHFGDWSNKHLRWGRYYDACRPQPPDGLR